MPSFCKKVEWISFFSIARVPFILWLAMDDQLALDNIRNVLTRLEETIIFGIIERAQFCRNKIIYQKNGVGRELDGESLVGFLLRESERAHAKVRRYTSPDEHPFYRDLPSPILPALNFKNPLHPNDININDRIREAYENEIIPFICKPGDDSQWGSSAVNDVMLLQALSKRIHYGKFVAESKYQAQPEIFIPYIKGKNRAKIIEAITDETVESRVLDRVVRKASTYGKELEIGPGRPEVNPEAIRELYARWIIPLNKDVQVLYLLERTSSPP